MRPQIFEVGDRYMITEMKYAEIPYVNQKVSKIVYGTALPAFLAGEDGNDLLDAIYALGITTFDTAREYQGAEKSLGKWIVERNMRDKIVILSKCGHPDHFGNKRVNEKEIRKDFAESVRYLNTDYIDIYLLHRDDSDVEAGEVIEIFNALHAEGKIGAFGGSNWTHTRIEEANEYAYKHNLIPFSVSSPHFSLAEQICDLWGGGCVSISGNENKAAREWYEKNQMPVIAYSSLSRGLFSGKVKGNEPEKAGEIMDESAMKGYGSPENFERLRCCEKLAKKKGYSVPQIAMAWLYGQKVNTFAVVSTSDPNRMKSNVEALSIQLNAEELQYLNLEREAF